MLISSYSVLWFSQCLPGGLWALSHMIKSCKLTDLDATFIAASRAMAKLWK